MKKNNFFNTKMVIAVCAILILIIVSCKKNDFSKDELFVYASPGNITNNSYIANYVSARNVLYPGNALGIPALITRPYNSDVQITAKIDTSLIRAYDSINGTTSLVIPPGAFALRNSGIVNIKAGQTSSKDSFYLDIIDTTKLDQSKSYIVPIILTANNAGISISPARQTMYLKISFKGVAVSSIKFFNGNSTLFTEIKQTPTIGVSGPDKITFGGFLNNTIFPKDVRITIVDLS